MKHLIIALLLTSCAHAGGKAKSPEIVASPTPSPIGSFVTLGAGTGSNVNRAFALEALAYVNQAIESGCLKEKVSKHAFKSLHNVFDYDVKDNLEAYARFVSGAPYALDLIWYSKLISKAIGYTYNYNGKESETRIWTNTRKMGDARMYAAHLAHELSHQARAGGYVHYTVHTGSFPYEIGTLAGQCIREVKP